MLNGHRRRKLIALVALLIVTYFFIVPFLWPDPSVEVRVPAPRSVEQDVEVEILISSLHSNVRLTEVSLLLDCPHYLEMGLPAGIYPIGLHQASVPRWASPSISRITFPRRMSYRFVAPIRDLAAQGVVRGGIVNGRLRAAVSFPHVRPRRRQVPGGAYLVGHRSSNLPFTWSLDGR